MYILSLYIIFLFQFIYDNNHTNPNIFMKRLTKYEFYHVKKWTYSTTDIHELLHMGYLVKDYLHTYIYITLAKLSFFRTVFASVAFFHVLLIF